MRKRFVGIMLSLVLIMVAVFSLVACNGQNNNNVNVSKEHREIIEKSIDALKIKWNSVLNNDGLDPTIDNKKIKIDNTIVYELKNDVTLDDCKKICDDEADAVFLYDIYEQYFKDIDYVVEFVILSDYVRCGMLFDENLYNQCLVSKDNYEITDYVFKSILYNMGLKYPFIEKTIDYGSAFDRTIDVSK